jgi:hypothetical protein
MCLYRELLWAHKIGFYTQFSSERQFLFMTAVLFVLNRE